ncbi:DoxX family protein [Pengzhenrongella frigida]|uniref:DoxX family membrane protein n=1 Tax=Pengzhenrongella frigida TaxID=1259133 RepID=A0A4Q5N4J1_9MICO|nr:DoxX family membrane protein [Cellulomonas sp. HLT2-17]RYV52283.1 DoxX family membrane protein [Cellulomonas sp. HLT2-17]
MGTLESTTAQPPARSTVPGVDTRRRTVGRIALGSVLVFAGITHLTVSRQEFQAQVPTWVPLDADAVVLASGIVEITLGTALVVVRRRRRAIVGGLAAAFFVAIFPGNISQLVTHTDAFGLDTDAARATRLIFQPLLVVWALWSTGAWRTWRHHRGGGRSA